jgi:peptidoglycan/xylan/chitin deacetylase (PgdA/CDA1 family)/broad-specificity NMP kinase
MIIELVGLPGGGKTTIAQALIQRGVHDARARNVFELFIRTLYFEFLHPHAAFTLAMGIITHAPHRLRYSMFMNGYMHAAAAYMKARSISRAGGIAVIDQGHAQVLIMLPSLPESVICTLPKPDLLVLVEASEEVRQERMRSRGRTPREEWGADTAGAWSAEVSSRFPTIKDFLIGDYPLTLILDGQADIGDTASKVMEAASHKKVQRASWLKQLTLAFASLITRGARSQDPAVLMYHAVDDSGWRLSISPQEFERQMAYIREHYTPVALSDVVAHARGEKILPAGAVAVTFDDGYADMATAVLPILQKHKIPATLFLTTDVSFSTSPYKLARITWEDIRTLHESGLVTIESHGRAHPHLPRLSEEKAGEELTGALHDIEERLGVRPRYFAYPFGDRTELIDQMILTAGYDAAFSIREGFVKAGSDVRHIPRIQVDRTMTFAMFRARLTRALIVNRAIVDFFRSV